MTTLIDQPVDVTGVTARQVRRQRVSRSLGPWLLLLPAIIVLAIGLGIPLVRQCIMAFQHYGRAQQFGQPATFNGVDNFRAVFTDPDVWAVVIRSLAFCAVNVIVTMLIATAIALLMTRISTTPRIVLQICLLLAWAMPVIAAMTVWQWLFDTSYGVINWTLVHLGLSGFDQHNWLINPLSFFFVATVIVVWMSVPFVVFTLYAALTQVSDEMLEASALDGASGMQRLRYIIYPTIRPVISIVVLLQIVWDLRVFAQINYLQGVGGTVSETNLLGTFIYQLGVGNSNYGVASALALLVLLMTLIISSGYIRSLLKEAKA